ncbi:hypothetical protein BC941DRAFT_437101 [Chlamydoabsidia padenii]|nr:hypothetical protein BC941DRAFT_437101 [Chlamydoabsidia padenii]
MLKVAVVSIFAKCCMCHMCCIISIRPVGSTWRLDSFLFQPVCGRRFITLPNICITIGFIVDYFILRDPAPVEVIQEVSIPFLFSPLQEFSSILIVDPM